MTYFYYYKTEHHVFLKFLHWVGLPSCWFTWAGEDVGSGEWAPAGSWPEGGTGVLARGGVPVLVLLVGVCLPGLGDELLSLLAYLGWGRCGIQGVCSSRVWVRYGAGVLVLRSLWGAVGFERFPAWGVLAQGGVSVLVLRVGVRCPGVWGVLLSLLAYLCCGDALANCGSLVFILWAEGVSFLFGPGASLSWGLRLEVWLPASFCGAVLLRVSFLSLAVGPVLLSAGSLSGGSTVLLAFFSPLESWENAFSRSFLVLVCQMFRRFASFLCPVPSFPPVSWTCPGCFF